MINALSRGNCIAKQVLEQLPGTLENSHEPWQVSQLGQGYQADVFLATRNRTIETCKELVVKVYKCVSAEGETAFENEVQTLRQFHEVLNGWHYRHWTFETPELYFVSRNPLAIAMSRVRGESLQNWLRSDPTLADESEAVVAALRCIWSRNILYGDLNLKNILYDSSQSVISFLDPGMPESFFPCEHIAADWYPASRDLAYLAFSVAASLKSTLASPAARRRQLAFVRAVFKQFLETIDSQSKQQAFIDEVRGCARTHVKHLAVSLSPSGLWRIVVKRLTQRCLDKMFNDLIGTAVGVSHVQ